MLNSLFEYLLKFSPLQYRDGDIVFQPGNFFLVLGTALLITLVIWVIYKRSPRYQTSRFRTISLALRGTAAFLLCLPLLEPFIVVSDVIPQENFVAVLVDNSASMGIQDGREGRSRYQEAVEVLNNADEGISNSLASTYNVRYYTFERFLARQDSLPHRIPDGRGTNLSAALSQVAEDFQDLPLAGVVLFTDGADNGLGTAGAAIARLREQKIPLHIVGLGAEKLETDRELLSVKTNKVLREGTGAEVEVTVRSWGEEMADAHIDILDDDQIVYNKPLSLSGNGKIDYFSFFFDPKNEGANVYRVRLTAAENEANLQNNSLDMLLDTRRDTIRVLHFQGHLNMEFKFIKRALEKDPAIEFVALSKTGDDKFYRQGIRKSQELSDGFPASDTSLFRYKVVLFGDIEANYFSPAQFALIEQFVRSRGGGFVMLGGAGAFSEGAYKNTSVADFLPTILKPAGAPRQQKAQGYNYRAPIDKGRKFIPTRNGLESTILRFSADLPRNKTLWEQLPPLPAINLLGDAKPGATVLAETAVPPGETPKPLLVTQRYGRGRSAALATISTWRWRMLSKSGDNRHERFWRQLIHWLAGNAQDPLNIEIGKDQPEPEEEQDILVNVFSRSFEPVEDATFQASITTPDGAVLPINLLPALGAEGEYQYPFTPESPGVYTIDVQATANGRAIGKKQLSFLASHSQDEYYNAVQAKLALENLASASNGQYYSPETAGNIPAQLKLSENNRTMLTSKSLWDLPLLFFLIVLILSAEWAYRRQKGLP